METSTTSADYTVTFDEDESLIDMQPSGKTATNFYPFTLKNGTAYTLAVQTDLFVVQQATKVLLSILPYVILMVFLLSLLCAWLYTRYITRPIVRLSKISKRMAELDFSGQCSTGREDELGCLAQNLNSLSASLSTALNEVLSMKNKKILAVGLCGAICLSLAGFTYANALASDAPKNLASETENTSGVDILYHDTDGGQISVDGKNWVAEADYEKNNAAPDVQWWTAEEYEAWMNEQKNEMV